VRGEKREKRAKNQEARDKPLRFSKPRRFGLRGWNKKEGRGEILEPRSIGDIKYIRHACLSEGRGHRTSDIGQKTIKQNQQWTGEKE